MAELSELMTRRRAAGRAAVASAAAAAAAAADVAPNTMSNDRHRPRGGDDDDYNHTGRNGSNSSNSNTRGNSNSNAEQGRSRNAHTTTRTDNRRRASPAWDVSTQLCRHRFLWGLELSLNTATENLSVSCVHSLSLSRSLFFTNTHIHTSLFLTFLFFAILLHCFYRMTRSAMASATAATCLQT